MEVGSKVKCLDYIFPDSGTSLFRKRKLNLPKVGEIYTIRGIITIGHRTGILLDEVRNKEVFFSDSSKNREPMFEQEGFQPFYPPKSSHPASYLFYEKPPRRHFL